MVVLVHAIKLLNTSAVALKFRIVREQLAITDELHKLAQLKHGEVDVGGILITTQEFFVAKVVDDRLNLHK